MSCPLRGLVSQPSTATRSITDCPRTLRELLDRGWASAAEGCTVDHDADPPDTTLPRALLVETAPLAVGISDTTTLWASSDCADVGWVIPAWEVPPLGKK